MGSDNNTSLIKRDTLILDILNGGYLCVYIDNSDVAVPWLLGREAATWYVNNYVTYPEQYELIEISEADYLRRYSFNG